MRSLSVIVGSRPAAVAHRTEREIIQRGPRFSIASSAHMHLVVIAGLEVHRCGAEQRLDLPCLDKPIFVIPKKCHELSRQYLTRSGNGIEYGSQRMCEHDLLHACLQLLQPLVENLQDMGDHLRFPCQHQLHLAAQQLIVGINPREDPGDGPCASVVVVDKKLIGSNPHFSQTALCAV